MTANRNLSPVEAMFVFFQCDEEQLVAMLHACIDGWSRLGRSERGCPIATEAPEVMEGQELLVQLVQLGAPNLRGVPTPLFVPMSELLAALASARAAFSGTN